MEFRHRQCNSQICNLFVPIGSICAISTYIYHQKWLNVGKYISPMDVMGHTPPKWNYIPGSPGNHPPTGPPVVQNRTFRCLTRSAWGVIGGSQVADSGFTNLSARSWAFWKKSQQRKPPNRGAQFLPSPNKGENSPKHVTTRISYERKCPFLSTKELSVSFMKEMSFQLSWEDRNLIGGVSHSRLTIASANWPSWIEKGYK